MAVVAITEGVDRGVLATRSEVAAFLRRKPQALAHWAMQGKGPKFMKLENGHVRYRWSDVDDWLNSQFVGGVA